MTSDIDYPALEVSTVKRQLEKDTGVDVFAAFDTELPDCLCVVVLGDVGPAKMSTSIQAALALGVPRICANVIEKEHVGRVRTAHAAGGFKRAWAESWRCSIATVRT